MSGHAACAVGSKIFLYGGRQGSQVRKYLRRLYIYDTGTLHGYRRMRILRCIHPFACSAGSVKSLLLPSSTSPSLKKLCIASTSIPCSSETQYFDCRA